jgi:hypothetical protein
MIYLFLLSVLPFMKVFLLAIAVLLSLGYIFFILLQGSYNSKEPTYISECLLSQWSEWEDNADDGHPFQNTVDCCNTKTKKHVSLTDNWHVSSHFTGMQIRFRCYVTSLLPFSSHNQRSVRITVIFMGECIMYRLLIWPLAALGLVSVWHSKTDQASRNTDRVPTWELLEQSSHFYRLVKAGPHLGQNLNIVHHQFLKRRRMSWGRQGEE